jgi:hypothetical protein
MAAKAAKDAIRIEKEQLKEEKRRRMKAVGGLHFIERCAASDMCGYSFQLQSKKKAAVEERADEKEEPPPSATL